MLLWSETLPQRIEPLTGIHYQFIHQYFFSVSITLSKRLESDGELLLFDPTHPNW